MGFSDRIDKEIQVCIQRMTLLRSAENSRKSLAQTLMDEEYQEIGNDLNQVTRIFDIFFKGNYEHVIDKYSQRIDIIKAVTYGEYDASTLCYFSSRTKQSYASLTFIGMTGIHEIINITTTFKLILILCENFIPESEGRTAFIQSLSEKYKDKEIERVRNDSIKKNATQKF